MTTTFGAVNQSTVVADPSTWGDGGGGATKVEKTDGDQTKTDATLVDATQLSFPLVANQTYRFRFNVIFRSTVSTVGLKLGLTFPAVSIFAAQAKIPIAAAGAGGELQGPITVSGGSVSGSAVPAVNTNYMATVEGIIRPSADGTLQLQFAAETTGATVTLKTQSVGILDVYP